MKPVHRTNFEAVQTVQTLSKNISVHLEVGSILSRSDCYTLSISEYILKQYVTPAYLDSGIVID